MLAAIRGETFGQDIGQNSWLTVDEYDRFIAWLQLEPGQHVLEVASGSGGPALYLARHAGCRVTGIDCNESGIATATRAAFQSGRRIGSISGSPMRTRRCLSRTAASMHCCASTR